MIKLLSVILILLANINLLFADSFSVVARVNNNIITQYDLDNYSKIFNIFYKNKNNNNIDKNLILNSLIEEIVKSDAIKNEKIPFDSVEFKYYLDSILNDNDTSKAIKANNVDMTMLTNIIKIGFMWSKLIDTKIKSGISVNSSEVNDSLEYLLDNPSKNMYNISQLTIYKTKNSDPKPIIEKLYSEIKEKNNFNSIASKFSQDNKENKGYVGWVDETDINDEINNALKNLQVGDITKPLYFGDDESGYYLIIKLNDKKTEKTAAREEISRVQYFIYSQKLAAEVKNYMDGLYNNAYIEVYN